MNLNWTLLPILCCVLAFGCVDSHDHDHENENETHHEHEHTAPHGGALVVLGEEFAHVEFVLDNSTGRMTAYLLDGEAEKGVRITQNTLSIEAGQVHVTLTSQANSLTGETVGDSSQFEGQSDKLKGLETFEAKLVSIRVKGKEFSDVSFRYPEGNE